MDRRVHRHRLLIALCAALLVHAGVAVFIVLGARRAASTRREPQRAPPHVLVELRTLARPPAPSAAPSAPPESATARDAPQGAPAVRSAPPPAVGKSLLAERAAGQASAAQHVVAPPRGAPAQAAGQGAAAAPAAGSEAWRAAEGLGPPGGAKKPGFGPGWGLSLKLRNPGAALGGKDGVADALPGPERVPSREERLAEEQGRVQSRVGGWVDDDAARLRVRDARDIYWQRIEDKLGKDFKVEWDILDKGPRGTGGVPRAVDQAAQAWQRAAQAYGKGGNPAGPDNSGPGGRRPLGDEWTHLSAEERGYRGDAALGNSLAPQLGVGAGGGGSGDGLFSHRLVVHLMITQGSDGSVLDVSIQGGSGNGYYDRLALAQARALGGGALGSPPHGQRRSLWSFESEFTQLPPFPIAGCALDEFFIPRDCFYPLKKMVKSRLQLEAVY